MFQVRWIWGSTVASNCADVHQTLSIFLFLFIPLSVFALIQWRQLCLHNRGRDTVVPCGVRGNCLYHKSTAELETRVLSFVWPLLPVRTQWEHFSSSNVTARWAWRSVPAVVVERLSVRWKTRMISARAPLQYSLPLPMRRAPYAGTAGQMVLWC